jgi:integral membrane sensor domain MASE1
LSYYRLIVIICDDKQLFLTSGLYISNFFIALSYFIAAQAGLLLAAPPSNAAAVWPAAGVATAAVIILGPRILPGKLIICALNQGSLFL